MKIRVEFELDNDDEYAADPDDPTGLTDNTYADVCQFVQSIGGYDWEITRVEE